MAAGVQIESLDQDSPLREAGACAGDRLLTINGREVNDHLDVRFHASDGELELDLLRGAEKLSLSIDEQPLPMRGVNFEQMRTKLCGSKCIFCFIDQLPAGVRPTLKVKDEDFRLSFLHGNYMTLNTLKDRDIDRILEQRLSPLYVSVHATDPEVRAVILGRPPKRPLIPTMEKLLAGGIELYGQIVLCPTLNDGAVLDETLDTLAAYYPGVKAVAVVPLGLSEHRPEDPLLQPVTREVARAVLERIHDHQKSMMAQHQTRFVFPGDEFYLKAELPIPEADYYEEFDQYEDGVGMVRAFSESFSRTLNELRGQTPALAKIAVVTGKLFAPILEQHLERLRRDHGIDARLVDVENRYLGSAINVAGLLGGADTAEAIRERGAGYPVVIPSEMVSRANGLLLDDYSPTRIKEESGAPELHAPSGAEGLIRLIWEGQCREAEGGGTYPHV